MGQENQLFIGHEDGAISCWELCRDSQRNYYCCTQSFLPLHQGAAIKKLHLTNDSRYLITHAKNKSHFIIIWDIKRNRALFEVEKKENFPLACIPSPCSTKFILSGNSTRKGAFLEQRSIVNGNILHDLLHDHDKKKLRFITASYAERGKKILALTVCGKLFVWDSSTGRFLQQLCLPRPCNDYYCTLFYSETNKTLLLLTRYGVVDYCFNEE